MKAISVEPQRPLSLCYGEEPEPLEEYGTVICETVAVGVCRTDVEIVEGKYGSAAPGKKRLVLGHESLGRVVDVGPTSNLKPGDLVVGIVRRPDPVPCGNCAIGDWDMCQNGQYTERGIKGIDGFMSERWRIEPYYAIRIDPSLGILGVLLEPASVVAKAWEQVFSVGHRSLWEPRTVLITGAGPIGLLAALLGKQHGLDVHVLDRVKTGPKPALVEDLGATYHTSSADKIGFQPDVIIECTGVGEVISTSIRSVGPSGVVCLTGVGQGGRVPHIPTADVAAQLVLGNKVIVGSVNANKRHWYKGQTALIRADRSWLSRLITRREQPEDIVGALRLQPTDIKVIVQFADL